MRILTKIAAVAVIFVPIFAFAHVGEHPSVHDTVASIVLRLRETYDTDKLRRLRTNDVMDVLTEEDRHVLGTEHITFDVNVPVTVSIMRDVRSGDVPFWFKTLEFDKTEGTVLAGNRKYEVWQKKFNAGSIGLGINSFQTRGEHYFVAVTARKRKDVKKLAITNIYPGQHTLGEMREGELPFTDENTTIASLPSALEGQVLLRAVDARKRDASMLGAFSTTDYVSSAQPDQVTLTWSDDPQTTQTIQWRTSPDTKRGVVAYAKKTEGHSFDPENAQTVDAQTRPMVRPTLANDPNVNRHTASLTELEPGTTYAYALGDGAENWTTPAEFTTAPNKTKPFSFVYMGDAQNGLDTWGKLVHKAHEARPDADFYIMAGDLVDRGNDRDNWDQFFANAKGIFDRKTLVPVPGNHEYQGGSPEMYLELFTLPETSPVGELAWSFEYSNALFVMLDSNIAAHTQTGWLDEQLAASDATWKFVVYHHPAYASHPKRNNQKIREEWGALFDKYHVDLALQGHDHAYLRTYPMKAGERAEGGDKGTIYIVSVSGTKYYEQGDFTYAEVAMTNTSTYQMLDITIDGDRLEYRAWDAEGKVRDEFVIEK